MRITGSRADPIFLSKLSFWLPLPKRVRGGEASLFSLKNHLIELLGHMKQTTFLTPKDVYIGEEDWENLCNKVETVGCMDSEYWNNVATT